jgi:ABC-type multidrug transport system fused ATPase/permease subunit
LILEEKITVKLMDLYVSGLRSISRKGRISVGAYIVVGILSSVGDGVLIFLISRWFREDSFGGSTISKTFMLGALVLTIFRPIGVIFLNSRIFRQLGKEESELSGNIFKIALKEQWSSSDPINEGEFINLVTNSPSSLVRGIIMRGSVGVSIIVNLMAIVIAIAIVDPINSSIFLFITVLLLVSSNRIYSHMISTLSTDKMVAMESVAGLVNIGLKTAKVLSVMPSKSFDSNYSHERSKLGFIGSRTEFLSLLPRSLFEIYLGFGLLMIFILSLNSIGSAEFYGKLVLYGAAAFRVFPLLSQLQSTAIQMKIENELAVNALVSLNRGRSIDSVRSHNENDSDDEIVISTNNLYFGYGKTSQSTLRDINIEIKRGEKIAIVGSSGSGKTTLLNVLMGLLSPTDGFISRSKSSKLIFGYVPQNSVPCGLPIANSIALEWDSKCIDYRKIDALIIEFNKLTMFCESNLFEFTLDTELSVGQQQSLGVMRALYRTPNVLILDEPSSALDENSQNEIMNIVFESDLRTVIMVTHRKETLKYVDRIFYIKEGQIFLENRSEINEN